MASYDIATVTNPPATLTDFTLVVDLSRMSASWWAAVNTEDATRGRVYKGDGTTRLAADWIDFNSTAKTGLLRVLWSGVLTSTGTQQLRIEPPILTNAAVAVGDIYGQHNAYSSAWWGYWPNGGGADRTSNARNMTEYGSPIVGGADGLLGKATSYNGTDQYSLVSAVPSAIPLTMLSLHRPGEIAEAASTRIIAVGGSTQNINIYQNTDDINARIGSPTDKIFNLLTLNTWTHVAGRVSTTDVEVYHDGNGSGTPELHALSMSTESNVSIGALDYNGTIVGQYNGLIEQSQILTADLSDEWITYESDQVLNNSTFYGTWTWVSEGGGDEVNLNNLTTGNPVIESGVLTQSHSLAFESLATSSPEVDAGVLTQHHSLSGNDITTNNPIVDDVSLTQNHSLSGNNITTGSPVIDSAILTQHHSLTGNNLITSNPIVDETSLTQHHSLSGNDITTGLPVVDDLNLVNNTLISLNNIETGNVLIDSVILTQAHSLSGNDITTSNPVIDETSLTQNHSLGDNALTTESIVIDNVILTQNHSLSGSNIITGSPVVDDLNFIDNLLIGLNDIITDDPIVDSANLTQAHSLSGSNITTGSPVVDDLTIFDPSGAIIISPNDITTSEPIIETAFLVQNHSLSGSNITTGNPIIKKPIFALSETELIFGLLNKIEDLEERLLNSSYIAETVLDANLENFKKPGSFGEAIVKLVNAEKVNLF